MLCRAAVYHLRHVNTMSYQISRDGKEIGIFTEEEVLAGVEDGSLLPSDHLWTSGMDDWVLVESLIEEDEEVGQEEAGGEPKTSPDTPDDIQAEEAAPEPPPVKKFTKVVVPVVNAAAAATAAPAPPPRVVVHVAPSAAPTPPPERVVMVPPSIMPGQYGVAGEATASLVFAILSLLCLCFTAVPAVVYGHLALSRIRRSGRAYGGEGLAIAGLVLGYFFIVISLILAVSYGMIASVLAPLIEQAAKKGG